jgi:hypothetical protein
MIPITAPAIYGIELFIAVLPSCFPNLGLAVLIPSIMQVTVNNDVMTMEPYTIRVEFPDVIETAKEIRIIANDISAEQYGVRRQVSFNLLLLISFSA